MTVYASARNENDRGEVVFRINEFDFGCLDKE